MKSLALLSILLNVIFHVNAQQDSFEQKVELQVHPILGFNGTLNSIKTGDFSDELVEFEDHEFFIEYLSLTAFIYKDWGISFRLQHILRDKNEDYKFSFSNSLIKRFNNDYFLPNQYDPNYLENSSNYFNGQTPKIYFGITKRFISKKLELQPSIYVGYSQIELQNYSIILKQRNNNRLIEYSIQNNHDNADAISNVELALGFRAGYRLNKYMLAQINLQYSYSQLNLTYVDEELDLYTMKKRIHTFEYPNAIHAYSVGLGITFELNNL